MVDSLGSTDKNWPYKARCCEQWPNIFKTSGPDVNISRNIRPGWNRYSVKSFLGRNLAVRRSLDWSNILFHLYSFFIEPGFYGTESSCWSRSPIISCIELSRMTGPDQITVLVRDFDHMISYYVYRNYRDRSTNIACKSVINVNTALIFLGSQHDFYFVITIKRVSAFQSFSSQLTFGIITAFKRKILGR